MDPTLNMFMNQMPHFVHSHLPDKMYVNTSRKNPFTVIAVKWKGCVLAFKRLPSIAPCLFSSFVCCLTFTMMDTMKCGDENNDHVCFKSSSHSSAK